MHADGAIADVTLHPQIHSTRNRRWSVLRSASALALVKRVTGDAIWELDDPLPEGDTSLSDSVVDEVLACTAMPDEVRAVWLRYILSNNLCIFQILCVSIGKNCIIPIGLSLFIS